MSFVLTLDNQKFTDPIEWRDSSVKLGWDDKFYLITSDASFTFIKDAAQYLIDTYDGSGFCTRVEAKLTVGDATGTVVLLEGYIFLSGLTIDRQRCTVQTSISDKSFNALIKQRQRQKFFLNVPRSINDVAITEAQTDSVRLHTVATGVHSVGARSMYPVFEAFRFLVEAMSDGAVGFVSDLFDVGGDYEYLEITTGQMIRQGAAAFNGVEPELSFKELFEDLDKLLNLGLWIEEIDGVQTVRIEEFDYFFSDDIGVTLDEVVGVSESIDTERLYATVDMGSGDAREFDEDTPNNSFPNAAFLGHFEESYNVLGECNVDNTLDLGVSNFVIDSNSIENQFVNAQTDQDDDLFLVDAEMPYGSAAIDSRADDYLNLGLYFYNERLSNKEVIKKWEGAVPGDIAAYLGDGDDEFSAERSSDTAWTVSFNEVPLRFDTELADPNANYDNTATNYKYIAPADGGYLFEVRHRLLIQFNGFFAGDAFITTNWRIGGATFATDTFTLANPGVAGASYAITVTHTKVLYLTTLDEVNIELDIQSLGPGPDTIQGTVRQGSTFKCLEAANGGGIYETFDPEDMRVVQLEFEHPISCIEWETILADRRKNVGINWTESPGTLIGDKGHPLEITVKPFGVSSVTLWKKTNQG